MSAFIIVKGNQEHLVQKSIKAFGYRKMTKYSRFDLSCGSLLLCKKELVDDDNFYTTGKKGLYCIGTPVYKGLSYRDSLRRIYEDLESNIFDCEKMRGNYVLIYDNGAGTFIIRDTKLMYKLFSDKDGNYITSSFLVATSLQPVTYNEVAFVEQLLCGFVSEPDTLVNEVSVVSPSLFKNTFTWIKTIESNCVRKTHKRGVKARYQEIVDYMNDVKPFVAEYGAECGLSGGCDSRLIYASVNEICGHMKSVHTHSTSDIHNKEIKTVRQLAAMKGTPLKIVPTLFLPECEPAVVDETLKENVLYFDGRNANIIGACSQTHTRAYKEKTSSGSGITFSGIGGEIYRDFYYTGRVPLNVSAWLKSRIFYGYVEKIVPSDVYAQSFHRILQKIVRDTGKGKGRITSWRFARRFFDEYRIPQALSNVVNANNQMNFYLAPFVEGELIDGARQDNKKQDHCGKYEGRIIELFSKELSSIISSKGYALNDVPHREMIKWYIRSFYPSFVWSWRMGYSKKPGKSFSAILHKSDYLKESFDFTKSTFPQWTLSPDSIPDHFMQNFVFSISTIKEINSINAAIL